MYRMSCMKTSLYVTDWQHMAQYSCLYMRPEGKVLRPYEKNGVWQTKDKQNATKFQLMVNKHENECQHSLDWHSCSWMKVVFELYRVQGRQQTEDVVKKHVTLIAVFFCRSLYNSLLWFHVSLHIMLEFMYVHIYTFTHGSMTAKVSGTYAWNKLVSIFLYKRNFGFIYTIEHLTAQIFNPLANLHNTTSFTNRCTTFLFYPSAIQQYVNQPYQTKLKHNRHT